MNDTDFLKEAVRVGNLQKPPRNFGTVIAKDGKIIASDHNHVHENHDPSAHAEISAIKKAYEILGSHNLEGCTMYGSHEPCLMCFSCAAWAKIDRVVYASPASESTNFSYEFEGVSLQELASHLARRPMTVELVRI
mgnify:CR=1 FL=1